MGNEEAQAFGRSHSLLTHIVSIWSAQTFLICQSTGILCVLLHQADWQFPGLQIISIVIWLLTICLLVIFTFLGLLKVLMFPAKAPQQLLSNPSELCCLSCAIITYGTIVDMVALVCAGAWGEQWGMVAYVLAWIFIALALFSLITIPYLYFRHIHMGIEGFSPALVLPSVSVVTAASTCGVVCTAGKLSPQAQVPMIIVGYLLLGAALPLSFALTVLFIGRLLKGSLPSGSVTMVTFTFLGPLGQGAYALQLLGDNASSPGLGAFGIYHRGAFLETNAGQVVGTASILSALILYGYGAFWLTLSLVMSMTLGIPWRGGVRSAGYTISAWSPLFPLGVYTAATLQFGKTMDGAAWKGLSSALIIILIGMTLINAALSLGSGFRKLIRRKSISDREA